MYHQHEYSTNLTEDIFLRFETKMAMGEMAACLGKKRFSHQEDIGTL